MSDVNDPRIIAGMAKQIASRDAQLADGAKPVGWKAGAGAPAAREALNLSGPLAGYLTDRTLVGSGAKLKFADYAKPAVECEIAVYIGADLSSDPSDVDIKQAITAIGPAIEVADISPPPTDVEAVIACNIYHRCVILGPSNTACAGGALSGLTCIARRDGTEQVNTDDLETATGRIIDVTRTVAQLIGTHGPGVKAGDFIIAGSITAPPLWIEQPQEISYQLSPIGQVSVEFV